MVNPTAGRVSLRGTEISILSRSRTRNEPSGCAIFVEDYATVRRVVGESFLASRGARRMHDRY